MFHVILLPGEISLNLRSAVKSLSVRKYGAYSRPHCENAVLLPTAIFCPGILPCTSLFSTLSEPNFF